MITTLMKNQRKLIKTQKNPRVHPKLQCDAWKLKFRGEKDEKTQLRLISFLKCILTPAGETKRAKKPKKKVHPWFLRHQLRVAFGLWSSPKRIPFLLQSFLDPVLLPPEPPTAFVAWLYPSNISAGERSFAKHKDLIWLVNTHMLKGLWAG